MVRVFVVASSAADRAALTDILRADARIKVVGSGPSLRTFPEHSLGLQPDVMLVDFTGSANDLLSSHFNEDIPIVLLANDWSRPEIRRALHNGARAVLVHNPPAEIGSAVEAAAAGLTVLSTELVDALLPGSPERLDVTDVHVEPLTPREIEVLALLAEGAGNKQIAARLGLSEHTVKFHVSSVLGKLGASSRTEAVAEGIRRGLVLV
jgi:NarL family two-component system response regulator YdfI